MGNNGFILALSLLILAVAMTSAARKSILEFRLGRLERKLDRVLDHLGLPTEEPHDEAVAALMRAGRKIEAIKEYRQRTGASLVEAKAYVEGIGATSKATKPIAEP